MPMEERKGYQWKEGTKEVMPMDGRKEGRKGCRWKEAGQGIQSARNADTAMNANQ